MNKTEFLKAFQEVAQKYRFEIKPDTSLIRTVNKHKICNDNVNRWLCPIEAVAKYKFGKSQGWGKDCYLLNLTDALRTKIIKAADGKGTKMRKELLNCI